MIIRTPDSRFEGLPDFDLEPRYATLPFGSETVRMAYIDQGPADAPPVVMLHGEPSWSFLYRHMIPIVAAAGLRAIVPDLIGFGRSDKPSDITDYTYARHVEWTRALLLDALALDQVTLFCQDWGGLIGLRLVAEHPQRFARVCAANTGLPDGTRRLPDAWWAFRDFVADTAELPVSVIVSSGVVGPMEAAGLAAYDAPFPTEEFKAGVRAFPDLIPQTLDNPATPDNQAAWRSLEQFTRPFLCLFSDQDPVTAGAERSFIGRVPGTAGQPHATVSGGHFLQEDAGPELARRLVAWIATDPGEPPSEEA